MDKFFSLFIFLLISFNSYSAVITENFDLTVISTNPKSLEGTDNTLAQSFNAGDLYSISVTYDNESTRLHWYDDGDDEIAEFGLGDDTIHETWCIPADPEAGKSECDDRVFSSAFSYFSDATFDFGSLIDQIDASERGNAVGITSTSYSIGVISTGHSNFWYQKDDFMLRFNTFGFAELFTYAADGSDTVKYLTRFSFPSTVVPEPSILALFAAGLVGLGFVRRRKHKA